MDRMIPLPHASEFLHARTQAVSDIFDGHPGAHTLGPGLLVCPGVARDRRRGMARAAHRVAGALSGGRAGRTGRSARHAAAACSPSSAAPPLPTATRPTL